MLRSEEFRKIYKYYAELYKIHDEVPYRSTSGGMWAVSRPVSIYYFFQKLNLQGRRLFIDAGSGDGVVVAVASIFTNAVGIEIDPELCTLAAQAYRTLDLANASVICGNYLTLNIYYADTIYIYPDKPFDPLADLLKSKNWSGELWVYGLHFPPRGWTLRATETAGRDRLCVYAI